MLATASFQPPPIPPQVDQRNMSSDTYRDMIVAEQQAFQRHNKSHSGASYLPAALRPNELTAGPTNIPNHPRAPMTPPQSKGNSYDSAHTTTSSTHYELPQVLQPAAEFNTRELHRRLDARLDVDNDPLEHIEDEVTGPPVTSHWKPNETSLACAVCDQSFTWYFRRHHCRKCGDVICGAHSQRVVKLDHNARFHPKGTASRACDPCHRAYKKFKELRLSRASSISQSQSLEASADTTPVNAVAAPALRVPGTSSSAPLPGAEAKSLGFYGNWSTF